MPAEFVVSGEAKCTARGCGRGNVESAFSTINHVGGNLRSRKETRFNGRSTNDLSGDRLAIQYVYDESLDR